MNEIFIEAEGFKSLGGWVIDQQSTSQMGSPYIMAHGLGVAVEDAVTTFACEKESVYRFFARTRDWTAAWGRGESAGKFEMIVDGKTLPSILGTNGSEWGWQNAGEIRLARGEHKLSLHDLTGFNGRCDAVFATDDMSFTPPDDADTLKTFRRGFVSPTEKSDGTVYDLIVVGGGVAGICTALSASRTGCNTLLIHDREVLGGCNSSEIRVCMGGMINLPPYENLGKIVKEIAPVFGSPQTFDGKYYEDDRKTSSFLVEKGCTLALGEYMDSAETEGGVIKSVATVNIRTGERTRYYARLFADCTGDAVLSRMAGASLMYGREAKSEFGESLGAEKHEKLVMGHSIRWYSKEESHETTFPDIDWSLPLDESTCYHVKNGDWEQETGFRRDMADETEYIRDYGLLAIFSGWSFQKNHSVRRDEYKNSTLVWASPLGGKRESYRVVGDHVLTQQDIEEHIPYPDASACITWSIDIHFPEPDNEKQFGEAFRSFAYHRGIVTPYPVPYRCLYSRDVANLFLGGRIISTTHIAFSAVRVMRTLGELGEVVGLAAEICAKHGCNPRDVYEKYLDELVAAMKKGVPSPDAFACNCEAMESYHFKDAGWVDIMNFTYNNEKYNDKISRNIAELGLSHMYGLYFDKGFPKNQK